MQGWRRHESLIHTVLTMMPTAKFAAMLARQVGANFEFWGDEYEGYMNHAGMQTDAYSANTALSDLYWYGQHLWRVEWRAGENGFMRWSLDGAVQFQLDASMLHQPRKVTFHENGGTDGFGKARQGGTRYPLEMPTEPMYIILNVDSSPKWGWPSHRPPSQFGDCDYPCECCCEACHLGSALNMPHARSASAPHLRS